MSRHISVVMSDDLFAKLEVARGRESRSSFVNYILAKHLEGKKKGEE